MTSSAILAEVLEVMNRSENGDLFAEAFDASEWLEAVVNACADVIEDTAGPRVSRDPRDDMFCWAAWSGRATHIVSKDPDLTNLKHYQGAQVVQPAGFLKLWRAQARQP